MARYRANDNLHSQLSQAEGLNQRRIDETVPAQPAYGPSRMREISSDQALTDFTMGGTVTGVAWSLNPYVGCLHACRYCYVPDTMHLERNRWGGYIVAKNNLPTVLRRELKTRPERTVFISTSTDPYQAPEREHRVTRRCLELLARRDWPVDILTRSPLVVRDLDVMRRFTRLRVGLSVPTLDDSARRILEPNAPPIGARLRALRRLADAGLTVYANHSPAYPPTSGLTMADVAQSFRDAGVQWINTSLWRRVPSFLGAVWDRLHKTPWKVLAEHMADAKGQESLQAELGREMRRVGIPMHTGFFNPPFESPTTYESSSQLRLEVELAARKPLAPSLEELVVPMGRRVRGRR